MWILHNNKYLDAMLKLMVISASIHFLVAFIHSSLSGDFSSMNYFHILEIGLIAPGIYDMPFSMMISFAAALLIFVFFALKSQQK